MGYPKKFIPEPEVWEAFLLEISKGKTRQEAAETVGGTATQFRTFINGKAEHSLKGAEEYIAALEAAGKAPSPHAKRIRELEGVQLAHRLLDETIMRALDSERGKVGSSNRMLYNLALLKLDDFKPLLEARTRHIHEGHIGLYAAMPQIDTDKLSLEEHRELVALEHRRQELIQKAIPDGISIQRPALPIGETTSEIVEDAEFAEVVDAG